MSRGDIRGRTGLNRIGKRFSRLRLQLLAAALVAVAFPAAASADLAFKPAVDIPVGDFPQDVASADLNGDGYNDLVTANSNSDDVTVLLGGPLGLLSGGGDFPAGNGPQAVEVSDLNRDGNLDLAVANIISSDVTVLLGTGTGSFGAPTSFAAGSQPRDLVAGDFNDNGRPDLAVTNGTDPGNVSVLLGTGSGSFGAPTNFLAGQFSRSIDKGDFNDDGIIDLVTANGGTSNVSVLIGSGSGTFAAPANFVTSFAPNAVAVSDLNNDGNQDLAVANAGFASVSILLGTGTGSFGAKTDFATPAAAISVVIGDLNADGIPDLGAGGTTFTAYLIGTGTGSFGPANSLGSTDTYALAAADLDDDGVRDLAAAIGSLDEVSIFLNSPVPSAAPAALAFGSPTPVPQGTVSSPELLSVTNDGVAPMKIDGFAFTGANPGDFFVGSDTCRKVILEGQSCNARMFFAPKAAGARSATVTALSNGPANPTASLGGIGGALPQGPTGPAGLNGQTGPAGPQGDPGRFAAITKVAVSGPAKVRKGKKNSYKVKITNTGNSKATGVGVSASGKGVSSSLGVGSIEAGVTKSVNLKLKVSKTGKVEIKFKVTSDNAGGKTVKKKVSAIA